METREGSVAGQGVNQNGNCLEIMSLAHNWLPVNPEQHFREDLRAGVLKGNRERLEQIVNKYRKIFKKMLKFMDRYSPIFCCSGTGWTNCNKCMMEKKPSLNARGFLNIQAPYFLSSALARWFLCLAVFCSLPFVCVPHAYTVLSSEFINCGPSTDFHCMQSFIMWIHLLKS